MKKEELARTLELIYSLLPADVKDARMQELWEVIQELQGGKE